MSSTKADTSGHVRALDTAGHVRALDGVRGLAILLVFLYDCLRPEAGGPINYVIRRICTAGWIGVDLFFVLSGFLITGILLDSKGRPGYFSSFFLRRSVRIFPLYYIALAFTFVVLPMWCRWSGGHPELESKLAALSADQVWYWTYLQNWLFAFRQSWPEPDYLKHFWSLAIEEQFYLVWPFVVAAVSLRSMPALCLAMIGTSVAVRTGLYLNGYHWVTTFAPTICRLDGLAMGALAATLLRTDSWRDRVTRWSPPIAAASLVGLFAVDKVWPVLANDHVGTHTIGHTFFAVVFASFIVTARTSGERSWLARGLSNSFLVLLGQLSYGLYVFHRPIHKFVLGWNLDGLPAGLRSYAEFAATLGLSLLVAGLSWILIEKPMLRLKRYFPRPDETRDSSNPPPAPEAESVQPTPDPDYHWPVREPKEPRGAEVVTSLR
ncbi:acyltransferase family protein [Planctomyces sp. SH-PL14]|uniref:acyltransferase family protein n=1 Tax=Planctomyces sp. SH-PL14 TaxID=1632864 RepID=UPI00078E65EF|nr:acyltransferase [Planctomyces sp. SH-PL14]AMV21451.1 O-acetyltransferase OatA [Planctomyces sp. SH-PL14]